MNLKILIIFSFILFFQTNILCAQSKVTNYLNVSESLKIENIDYHLVWSSHPDAKYYKQEYLNKNETLDTYQTLVLIEFIKGDFQLDEVINQKVAELDFFKKTNPIVHYQVYENNGEYILDFLISQNSEDVEKILIAERNVYRYKLISEGENKGVLLFAISERGYENNMDEFFNNLKNNSTKLVETVGNYTLPKIQPQ